MAVYFALSGDETRRHFEEAANAALSTPDCEVGSAPFLLL